MNAICGIEPMKYNVVEVCCLEPRRGSWPQPTIAPGKSASAGRYGGFQTQKRVQPRRGCGFAHGDFSRTKGAATTSSRLMNDMPSVSQRSRWRANVGLWPKTSSRFVSDVACKIARLGEYHHRVLFS